MSLVKAEGTPENLDSLISQAEAASGIVAIAVTAPEHFLSNVLIERAASEYGMSMLYGGPTCSVIECMLPADSSAAAVALLSGRLNQEIALPLVATYSQGALSQVVLPATLQETLAALGAKSASTKAAPPGGGEGSSSGKNWATAVDDIDFTGGAGNAGRPGWVPEFKDAGRTTGKYAPGWNMGDKAGDYITKDDGDGPVDRSRIVGDNKGPQGGPPGRKDKPPGV